MPEREVPPEREEQTERPQEGAPEHGNENVESKSEAFFESQRHADAARLQEIRKEIQSIASRPVERGEQPAGPEEIRRYVASHYPPESRRFLSDVAYGLFRTVNQLLHFRQRVEGHERVPESPYLIVASHEGGESGKLAAAFEQPLHITAGRVTNFSSPLRRALFTLLKIIPFGESLGNLSREERRTAVDTTRSPFERRAYETVLRRTETSGLRSVSEDIRRAVACLLEGEPVVVYPQGIFSRGREGRPGSGGYSLIAQEYKRLTGQELPILPVEVKKEKVTIRQSFTLPPYDRQSGESHSAFYGRIAMERIGGHMTGEHVVSGTNESGS